MRLATALLLFAATGGAWLQQAPDSAVLQTGSEKNWAVVVGISRYQILPKEKWLEYADADAQAFAAYLSSGQGLRFLPDRVFTLTNEQATKSQVERVLGNTLVKKVKPGDTVYVFLAAHGVVELFGPRDAYVLAYNSSAENLYETAVSFPLIQDALQRRLGHAARVILLTDTCRAGKMAETKPFARKLEELKSAELLGLLASAPEESSLEGESFGGGHGAFTFQLLRGLQGDADLDRNGFVSFDEISRFVREEVPKVTQDLQHPGQLGEPSKQVVLSAVREERADLGFSRIAPVVTATLIFSGPAKTELHLDGVARGVVSENGQLAVEGVSRDNHKLMAVTPRGLRVVQEIQVSGTRTEVEFNGRGLVVRTASARGLAIPQQNNLLVRFHDALARHRLLEPVADNAREWLRQMEGAVPPEQIQDAREMLQAALEDEGQRVLLAYLRGDAARLEAADFERGAALYAAAAELSAAPQPLQVRRDFCAARALLYRGRLAEAIALLQDALRREPRSAVSLNALGLARFLQGQYRESLVSFQAASDLAQYWAYPHFNRALAYTALNQLDRAEEAYLQAIRLGPRYAYLHYGLAALYMSLNRPERAEQEYRRALELDPDAATGHTMLGNFFLSRERQSDAEQEFRRALQFHAGDVPARLNLAALYRSQDRPRLAERELQQALGKVETAPIHEALGDLYLEMRRRPQAAEHYRQAATLAEDPKSRAVYEQKAQKAQPPGKGNR